MYRPVHAILASLLLAAGSITAATADEAPLPKPVADQLAERSDSDPRVRQYVRPVRIVWTTTNSDKSQVENAEQLLKPFSGQITLGNKVACTLRNNGEAPGVLVDFGCAIHGGVQIAVCGSKGNKPVRVRVRFGESVSEAMSDVGGKSNATNDHAIRDQTCLVPWLGTHEIGNTGFRFARIDLVDEDSFVQIAALRGVFLYRNLEYKGSFRCNDERLNRIWNVGAYTVHLNMQDYVWDGFKRDRLVWIGDMHPETMTINSVFGDVNVVKKSLDLIRDETPLPGWMNGISSYSMWWALIHHTWYKYHGDVEYLEEQHEYLAGLMEQLIKHIGPDGKETLPPHRFLDWPSSTNPTAIHAGLQSLMILTLEAGAEMAETLDDAPLAKKCTEAVARLRKHVPDHGNSKQAAALMALAGLADAKEMNSQVMAVDGVKRMSTFYGYYVLQAREKAGDTQGLPRLHPRLLGCHARPGRNHVLGGLRHRVDEECRADRRNRSGREKGRPRRLRQLLLQGPPPQPLPRLGVRPHLLAHRTRPWRLPRRAGLQDDPHRSPPGRPRMGRRDLPHPHGHRQGPPRKASRRNDRVEDRGSGGGEGGAGVKG